MNTNNLQGQFNIKRRGRPKKNDANCYFIQRKGQLPHHNAICLAITEYSENIHKKLSLKNTRCAYTILSQNKNQYCYGSLQEYLKKWNLNDKINRDHETILKLVQQYLVGFGPCYIIKEFCQLIHFVMSLVEKNIDIDYLELYQQVWIRFNFQKRQNKLFYPYIKKNLNYDKQFLNYQMKTFQSFITIFVYSLEKIIKIEIDPVKSYILEGNKFVTQLLHEQIQLYSLLDSDQWKNVQDTNVLAQIAILKISNSSKHKYSSQKDYEKQCIVKIVQKNQINSNQQAQKDKRRSIKQSPFRFILKENQQICTQTRMEVINTPLLQKIRKKEYQSHDFLFNYLGEKSQLQVNTEKTSFFEKGHTKSYQKSLAKKIKPRQIVLEVQNENLQEQNIKQRKSRHTGLI